MASPLTPTPTITTLPNEVLTKIAVTLPPKSLNALIRTNSFFHEQFTRYLYHINANEHAGSALHWAARNQVLGTVKLALEAGVSVDHKEDETEYTPLIAAVASQAEDNMGVIGMVLFLLDQGADLHAVEKNGRSALLMAVGHGAQKELVQVLLDLGGNVNDEDFQGTNALKMAVLNDADDEVIKLLIDHGADMLAPKNGYSAFAAAIVKGDLALVTKMLDAGVCVEQLGFEVSPLAMAAGHGHDDLVRLFIARGANINRMCDDGSTALTQAINNKNGGVVNILLNTPGIELNPSMYGIPPLNSAVNAGDSDLVRLLVNRGAHVNRCDMSGHSPLIVASAIGNTPIAAMLLSFGAVVNNHWETEEDNFVETPLHAALFHEHWNVAKLLLAHGADACAINKDDVSVLHLAAWKGNEEIVKELLDRGANVFVKTILKATPLDYAVGGQHVKVASLIQDAMAKKMYFRFRWSAL